MSDDPFDQHGFNVRFEWGVDGLRRLARLVDVVVIVDVLSFCTAVDVALARGAEVLPYRSPDGSEREYARRQRAVVAAPPGEATDETPWTLRPSTLEAIPDATRLVLPSPNGSALAFEAERAGASLVMAGCFRNASATAARAGAAGQTIAIIGAGERWGGPDGVLRPCAEDLAGAGAIAFALRNWNLSPEARVAAAAYEAFARTDGGIPAALAETSSGRELLARGGDADVALAGDLDASAAAAVLVRSAFVAS